MTGIPPLPIYSQSDSPLPTDPHNSPSNLVLTSPVERKLCEFFQELNQSSSLGLTGSEVLSLAKGNFVPSPSNFRVEGPRRIPSSLTDFAADLSGFNCGTNGLNSILPAAERPNLDQGPPSACKSDEKERTREKTVRLHTFSTAAGLKGPYGGKSPKSLVCSHESFPHDDLSTLKSSIGRTSSSRSKSSGSGHQCNYHGSSEASFQCRVIKLSQREHTILRRYEKMTKSIEKLNQGPTKKHVQLFLLSRSQEIHVSGRDFEFARTQLLKFIRLSQVWWDKGRQKEATVKLTPKFNQLSNLKVQERLQKKMSLLSKLPSVQPGPQPGDVFSMTGASNDTSSAVRVTSKRTSVGGIFQLFPHLCASFPDCSNTSPDRKISKNCSFVIIQDEFFHDVLIQADQKLDMMQKISSMLAVLQAETVKVSLLRKTPVFHVLSDNDRFTKQAMNYLLSLLQRCRTLEHLEDEFGYKSTDPREVPQGPQQHPQPPKTTYISPLPEGTLPPPCVFLPPPAPKVVHEQLRFLNVIKAPPPLKGIKPPTPNVPQQPLPSPTVKEFSLKKSPQKRPPPPSTPNPSITHQAIPVVAKPTPPKNPRISRAEKQKHRSNVGLHPNSRTPNQQRSWAWEPPKTPDTGQTNNINNNNFPPHPRNRALLEARRMRFGRGPLCFDHYSDYDFPRQPRHNPRQPQ